MLGPAGASDGFSLTDKIEQLSMEFASSPSLSVQFAAALKACGSYYRQRADGRKPVELELPVGRACWCRARIYQNGSQPRRNREGVQF